MSPFENARKAAGKKQRVLFVGASDTRGGAAIASARLIRKLAAGKDAFPLEVVARQKDEEEWTFSLDRVHDFPPWMLLRKFIGARNIAFSDRYGWLPFESAYFQRVIKAFQPDIVHLQNLHGALGSLPLNLLPWLSRHTRIVWTLHDMWAASGHCAYSLGCERWKEGCGECPDLSLYPSMMVDRTRTMARRKHAALQAARPVLVSPSAWLTDLVENAWVTRGLEACTIANGIDLDVFSPGQREETRLRLGIAPDSPVIMFAAESLDQDKRKGARELREALRTMQQTRADAPIDVILMGNGGEGLLEGLDGLRLHPAGYVDNPVTAAGLYGASDLFVCPSMQDNLPNTLLEAAACATAAVTFNAGGSGETIESGVTGRVIPAGNANALGEAIAELVADHARLVAMGAAARARAERLYSDSRMASDYRALYARLISDRKVERA